MENLEETIKAAEANVIEVAKKTAIEAVEETNKSIEGLQATLSAKDEVIKSLEAKIEEVSEIATKASAEVKKQGQKVNSTQVENIELQEVVKAAFIQNSEVIKSAALGGELSKKSVNLEEVKKDITNASFTGNALANISQRVRPTVYQNAYAPIWLKNLFTNITTDGGSIVVPQIQAYSGGVAVWERGTGSGGADVAKPDVNVTYKDVTVTPKWIAGKMRVNRELLLNVPYLSGSVTNTLLYSPVGLYAAENKMIVDYLAANSVAYAGDKEIGVEMIVDAAFGQMLGNYIQADYVFLNNFDYVEFVALNKAAGSGEYDLPNGLEVSVIDGALFINQLKAVPVPSIPKGTAYVVASSEFEFITRLGAELRMFEQSQDDAEKNKVLFRVEELAAFWVKNVNASVKITLPAVVPAG